MCLLLHEFCISHDSRKNFRIDVKLLLLLISTICKYLSNRIVYTKGILSLALSVNNVVLSVYESYKCLILVIVGNRLVKRRLQL